MTEFDAGALLAAPCLGELEEEQSMMTRREVSAGVGAAMLVAGAGGVLHAQ